MRHHKAFINDNHNHNNHNHGSKNHNQQKKTVGANEWRKDPQRIWTRTTRWKSRSRWTREEEILICECWIETSENSDIKVDRNENSINGDCQKFDAIYKHLERKSGENEVDHIETANTISSAQIASSLIYAYEAKKEKELAYMECKELEFLMIDPESLPEPKASII
ncbi:hypothetical protein Tco_0084089 [Tanacetum coccineum]